MSLIWSFVISVVAALIAGRLIAGIQIKSITAAAVVALVLSVAGTFLSKMLMIFLAPLNWITLGILGLVAGVVVNAILVMMMDKKVKGFEVDSFSSSLFYCIVLALVQMVLRWIF